ncbi:hypothetical protein JCM16418A_22320 [Paenibacillus pini]
MKSLLRMMNYSKISRWLVFERLTMISDCYVVKSDEIDTIIQESMKSFHQAMTEFLCLVDKYARASMVSSVSTDAMSSNRKLKILFTELLSTTWDLLETYDAIRFRFDSVCPFSEITKLIQQNKPEWLEALISSVNRCHQVLIRHSASSSEAFSYIHKIKSYIKNTTQESYPSQTFLDTEKRIGNNDKTLKNSRTKPFILIK